MTTVSKQTTHDDDRHLTYFAYLSRTGQMPPAIKSLIDRYRITMYFDACDVGGLESVRPDVCDTEKSSSTASQQVNFSFNNNDDDDVETPASQLPAEGGGTQTSTSPTKVIKLKLPSVTRRLSKFGKRSSSDKNKNKTGVEEGSPSDSQLTDSPSTSMTTVDEPHIQTPDTCIALNYDEKTKDLDNRKDKYEEGNYCRKKTRRALGRAHVSPTKLFQRLLVNKTILKPRLAAIRIRVAVLIR